MLTELKCTCCGETKDISNFHKRKDTKLGYRLECKSCVSQKSKKSYVDNIEKVKASQKKYRERNVDKIKNKNRSKREYNRLWQKHWRERNKDVFNEYRKDYYQKNKDRIKEQKKVSYSKNKGKHRERQDKYDLENKDRLREARRKWERERLANDEQYRLSKNLRRRISLALTSKKEYRTSEYLGCNVGFLMEYLEKQFTPEMNWDNYGTYWHIDHKTPVSWFDLTNKEEAAKAFHYTNMQPLEAKENILKNNRYRHV